MSDAIQQFAQAWNDLPDRSEPPTDGPFFIGDICKVRGEVWVFRGADWVRYADERDRPINIQLTP